MGKLTNDEMKEIIRRASILQKFHEQSLGQRNRQEAPDDPVFEIGDSLKIKRHFIQEALLEYEGIQVEDPVVVDTNSSSQVEIQGYANGSIDGSLLNEIRAQLQYHFNTVGALSRRKGNIYWKANPAFPARLFDITRTPELEIKEKNGRVKLSMRQSLKTLNKLYFPPIGVSFGAFMMFAAVVFDQAGNDEAPMLIVSAILLLGSFGFSRLVKALKRRRKRQLLELVETIQQIMERRFQAGKYKEQQKPEINMEEFQDIDELDEIEIKHHTGIKS